MSDDRLSRFASRLLQHAQSARECYEDLSCHYAPSECYRDVSRGLARELQDILAEYGFADIDEAHDALAARTTPRIAYELTGGAL